MTTDLSKYQPSTIVPYNNQDLQRKQEQLAYALSMAKILFDSGYYPAENIDQVVAKILMGLEIGMGAMQSMDAIHSIPTGGGKSRLVLHYTVLASWVRQHPHYDYEVVSHTNTECVVRFYSKGKAIGDSSYTWAEARTADLIKNPAWGKYTKTMLFKTALVNGVRYYCPDIIYTHGGSFEMLADTFEEPTNAPINEYDLARPTLLRLADAVGVGEQELLELFRLLPDTTDIDLDDPTLIDRIKEVQHQNS